MDEKKLLNDEERALLNVDRADDNLITSKQPSTSWKSLIKDCVASLIVILISYNLNCLFGDGTDTVDARSEYFEKTYLASTLTVYCGVFVLSTFFTYTTAYFLRIPNKILQESHGEKSFLLSIAGGSCQFYQLKFMSLLLVRPALYVHHCYEIGNINTKAIGLLLMFFCAMYNGGFRLIYTPYYRLALNNMAMCKLALGQIREQYTENPM